MSSLLNIRQKARELLHGAARKIGHGVSVDELLDDITLAVLWLTDDDAVIPGTAILFATQDAADTYNREGENI